MPLGTKFPQTISKRYKKEKIIMMAHETVSLNDKVALAKRVSLWNIDDIDLLFSSANSIQLKFGIESLISARFYGLFRTELLRIAREFKLLDNEKIRESILNKFCDSSAIFFEFLQFKEENRELTNPLSFVFFIASWAYISKCEKTKAIAYRVFSDLGFPVKDIHTKNFSSQR